MAVHRMNQHAVFDAEASAHIPPPDQWRRRPCLVSLVVPVFREEQGIAHFCEAVVQVLGELKLPFEIVFVEDDSPDGSLEQIRRLQREGHPISPGSTGENITLDGIGLDELTPGTHLLLGEEVELEITAYAAPCTNIRDSFNDGNFTRISMQLYPGESRVYARVLRGGVVSVGQTACIRRDSVGDAADG